jgi:hypothetical protein
VIVVVVEEVHAEDGLATVVAISGLVLLSGVGVCGPHLPGS